MAVPKVESRGEGENLSERERETETETEEGVGSLHATVSTGAKELFRGNSEQRETNFSFPSPPTLDGCARANGNRRCHLALVQI